MIEVRQLSIQIGDFSLRDVSFSVPDNRYAVLMGRTGSGKTTILSSICGLVPIDSGQILLDGHDVTNLPPAARGVGYVPQDGALFPTMTVHEHLAFPLEIRHWTQDNIDQRVEELADLLGISDLLTRLPQGLSGGESQRVALGRALSFRPDTLLLDEPLSALDEETCQQMYELLKHVQQVTHVTALHITHNRDDALHLADCLFQLKGGAVTQCDGDESRLGRT